MDRTESSSGDDTDQVVKNRMNVVLESQSLRQEKPLIVLKGFMKNLKYEWEALSRLYIRNFMLTCLSAKSFKALREYLAQT